MPWYNVLVKWSKRGVVRVYAPSLDKVAVSQDSVTNRMNEDAGFTAFEVVSIREAEYPGKKDA